MAKLEWRWDLPGESIQARSESGVESVYAGPRLLSRSSPAGKPEGHEVLLGDRKLLVVFNRAKSECCLKVDGAEVPPALVPPKVVVLAAPQAAYRRSWGWLYALVAFALIGSGYLWAIGWHSPLAAWKRFAAGAAPMQDAHLAPDGSFQARYPLDFTVRRATGGTMLLTRKDDDDAIVFLASQPQSGADAQAASVDLVATLTAGVADLGITIDALPGVPTTCHGQTGVVITGVTRKGSSLGHLFTCVFLQYEREYMLASLVTGERRYVDEPELQGILDATAILRPRLPAGISTGASSGLRRQ